MRSESQSDIQAARLIAEMAAEIGVEFNVQVVSTGKLTELTVQKVDGVPAPAFDTFVWGWGGDPYDPSFLLSLFTTGEIGASSDSFYSNPEYDRLFEEQSGEFDVEARKEIIAGDGRAHPGGPALRRPHRGPEPGRLSQRPARATSSCRARRETGDPLCEQVSVRAAALARAGRGRLARRRRRRRGGSLIAIGAPWCSARIAFFARALARGTRADEPLELEE